MKNTFLIITSIADSSNKVLQQIAKEAIERNIKFYVIGDTKSPKEFHIPGCDFFSIEDQEKQDFSLIKELPYKHYARKNIGYLMALKNKAEVIIETDDDNIPYNEFWSERFKNIDAHVLKEKNWVNVYKYFTKQHIWPRGFSLQELIRELPELPLKENVFCPIQQGLANENPDVDAIYRLTLPLPISFDENENVALGKNSICPFNSQNTTWFKEAFPLMYLPYYCSFRMTDIWRSFVAQRIAWTCDWSVLFHKSTVWQERNEHDLMIDFNDEISGYQNNHKIMDSLIGLPLRSGIENIYENILISYEKLIQMELVGKKELPLLNAWLDDVKSLNNEK